MQYRTLGRTSLNVSVLGFGASPLGDVFGITDPKEGERAVKLAVDRGINFFDVSSPSLRCISAYATPMSPAHSPACRRRKKWKRT